MLLYVLRDRIHLASRPIGYDIAREGGSIEVMELNPIRCRVGTSGVSGIRYRSAEIAVVEHRRSRHVGCAAVLCQGRLRNLEVAEDELLIFPHRPSLCREIDVPFVAVLDAGKPILGSE